MNLRIAVMDNGGQYAHLIYRTFQDIGVYAKIYPNITPLEEISADGMAFSGSGSSIGNKEVSSMGNCEHYLENFNKPILGMCAGHQLIAKHFGGVVKPAKVPEFGKTKIYILNENDLFKGIPKEFTVWNSHNDEVSEIPECMEELASSDFGRFEAIKHKEKPIYGVQFHPEVQHTEHREEIFKNFLEVVKVNKKQ